MTFQSVYDSPPERDFVVPRSPDDLGGIAVRGRAEICSARYGMAMDCRTNMVGEENPIHIWERVKKKHLSFRMVGSSIIGAVVGSLSMSSVYFSQVFFDPNGENRSFWRLLLIGASFGAFLGYIASKHRNRNCPNCGLSMGASQNIRSDGFRRASRQNQLALQRWFTRDEDGVQEHIENYYLCKNCDLEFRMTDLE